LNLIATAIPDFSYLFLPNYTVWYLYKYLCLFFCLVENCVQHGIRVWAPKTRTLQPTEFRRCSTIWDCTWPRPKVILLQQYLSYLSKALISFVIVFHFHTVAEMMQCVMKCANRNSPVYMTFGEFCLLARKLKNGLDRG